MKESTTYQAILEEGRVEEAKRLILLMAEEDFGPVGRSMLAAIEAINNRERLEELGKKLRHVSSWQELIRHIEPPTSKRRKSKP